MGKDPVYTHTNFKKENEREGAAFGTGKERPPSDTGISRGCAGRARRVAEQSELGRGGKEARGAASVCSRASPRHTRAQIRTADRGSAKKGEVAHSSVSPRVSHEFASLTRSSLAGV